IKELDTCFREAVENGHRKVMVFGDRFPLRYFVEEYGLEYFAAFPGCSSDTEASAATVAFLIDKVREESIPVVFKIELSSDSMARTIAEDTGTRVLTFNTCHNITKKQFKEGETYVSLMYQNLEALKEALE
ncbi:MAG: metal ABC transporter substrate-binding protein, partial [Butyrivibrio sp.]